MDEGLAPSSSIIFYYNFKIQKKPASYAYFLVFTYDSLSEELTFSSLI